MARRPRHAWEDDEEHAAGVREGPASSRGSRHAWEDYAFPELLATRLEEEGIAVDRAALGAGDPDDPGALDSEGEDSDSEPARSANLDVLDELLELVFAAASKRPPILHVVLACREIWPRGLREVCLRPSEHALWQL